MPRDTAVGGPPGSTRHGYRVGVNLGPQRILITGSAGCGKTRLGGILSARLGLPHIELDGLYHGPNWTAPDPEAFRSRVAHLVEAPRWIVDGNYSVLGDIVRSRADLLIAIDLPRPVVLAQLLRRTGRRLITGAELWNGNRENWRNLLRTDPKENILLWSHVNFGKLRARAKADERAGSSGGLPAVRLTSRAQVARFTQYLVNRTG